jgi:hypothetical protein
MFDIKLEGIDDALKQFDSKKVITAARQAINRTADSTRTEASRLIRTEYNIKASRLNQYLRVEAKASGNSLTATITGRGRGLALSYFDVKQTGVVANKKGFRYTKRAKSLGSLRYGGAVTALVKLAGGRKIVTGKYDNKPFVAQMKSGHTGVWVRTGKGRHPIEQQYGPGVGGLFGSKAIMDRIKTIVVDKFRAEFNRLLDLKR